MNCTTQVRDSRCDGNGYFCLPQGVCVCDLGWTALGAFSTIDGRKCDIHQNSIYGLNIIDTTLVVAYLLLILQHLARRLHALKDIRLFLSDPKTPCSFIFMFIGISDLVVSLSAVLYKERKLIGKDTTVSIAAAMFAFFCFVGLSVYFQIMVNFMRNSARLMTAANRHKVLSRLTVLRNLSWAVVPLSIPICMSSIFCLIFPENMRPFAMTAIIGIGLLIFFYTVLYLTALGFIVAELSAYLEKSQSEIRGGGTNTLFLVCRRLKLAYNLGGSSLLGGAGLMILCGSWDFLFRKFAYVSILLRLNSIFFFIILFVTISGVTNGIIASNLMTVRSAMVSRRIRSLDVLQLTGQSTKASGDMMSGASHSASKRLHGISQKLGGMSQKLGGTSQKLGGMSQKLGGMSQKLGGRPAGKEGVPTKKPHISPRMQGLSVKVRGASEKIHVTNFCDIGEV